MTTWLRDYHRKHGRGGTASVTVIRTTIPGLTHITVTPAPVGSSIIIEWRNDTANSEVYSKKCTVHGTYALYTRDPKRILFEVWTHDLSHLCNSFAFHCRHLTWQNCRHTQQSRARWFMKEGTPARATEGNTSKTSLWHGSAWFMHLFIIIYHMI